MKAKLPMMIDDPQTAKAGLDLYERFETREEDFFLDGPVSRRIAVLDFADDGKVLPGARFVAPGRRKFGSYEWPEDEGIFSRAFQQINAFSTVLRTMYLFEEPDTLGRRLTWAFNAPQLLVLPRAGEMPNAFYERESHSLQLFSISRGDGEPPACACLSRDIIAHETAHAILDGIAPDLYNALTPQSLALHEAIADLTALLMSFRSSKLREAVLEATNGSIADSTAFSTVAPEFGQARDPSGTARYLRSLLNRKTLDPNDESRDEIGARNQVSRRLPHSLSQALSGALYTVMVKIHGSLSTGFSASGKALFVAGERFKRMILRALDYLPPGEVSFGDYGRAILAADQAAHPEDGQERQWICDEFVSRALVPNKEALEVETNFEFKPLAKVNLETLARSDWAAYQFADKHREFLGIPPGIAFRVRPRLDTTKCYYRTKGAKPEPIRELIFKVSWDQEEPNHAGRTVPDTADTADVRQITVGTTVAIDWETRAVRARLTSQWQGEQQADRDSMLRTLAETGALRGEGGRGLRVESSNGLMRVRGTVRMLHLDGAAGAPPPMPIPSPRPVPPPGVDAGAFYDLLDYRRQA